MILLLILTYTLSVFYKTIWFLMLSKSWFFWSWSLGIIVYIQPYLTLGYVVWVLTCFNMFWVKTWTWILGIFLWFFLYGE